MPPIYLSSNPAIQSSDDSGLLISKRALPLYYHGPYTQDLLPHDKKALPSLDYVAPLEYYCIKCLFLHVDQLDLEGAPRIIFDMNACGQLRLMKTLMPFFSQRMRPSQMKFVDPRLWATLIQLFTHLPSAFRSYSLPLSDMYLPLLRTVKSSVDFTLITILDLSCETELTDDTIGQLKPLTNICVLDISSTKVSTWGIKQLSMCLTRDEASGVRFGPWNIRILSMKDCRRIRDDVKPILQKFPLLAIIDLRGTSITDSTLLNFESRPSPPLQLCYYPCSTISWIDALWKLHSKELFRCRTEKPYILHVDTLEHPPPHMICDRPTALLNTKMVSNDDQVLVLLPDGKNKCKTTDELTQEPPRPDDYRYQRSQRSTMDYDEETESEWSKGNDSTSTSDYYVERTWEETAESVAETLSAREFYGIPTSRLDVGEMSGEERIAQAAWHRPLLVEPGGNQLKFMFFRHPPSIDNAHSHFPPNVNDTLSTIHKRQRVDSKLMRKKAKTTDFTKAFLSTMTSGARKDEEPNISDHTQSTLLTLSTQVSVSVNPFRAKKVAVGEQTLMSSASKADLKSADPTQKQPSRTNRSNTLKSFNMKAWLSQPR